MSAALISQTVYQACVGTDKIGPLQSVLEAAQNFCIENDPGKPMALVVLGHTNAIGRTAGSAIPHPTLAWRFDRSSLTWKERPTSRSIHEPDN